ncbi:MAG TPA: histidine phosphatase family protein [Solirubrobacterales bacterium]
MTRAIFVRHGESVSNAHPELAALPLDQGDRLTDLGRRQSLAAGEALRALEPTVLISSPMGRARETAELIGERLGMAVRELPYISELRESRDYASMSAEDQKLRRWSVWMAEHGDDPDFSWHGAETFEEVRGRVRRLKDELEREYTDQRPLIVTHGLFLRFFLFDSLLGDAFGPNLAGRLWYVRSVNCGVSVFEQGERWHPADADTPGWSCVSWMSRPWDPP